MLLRSAGLAAHPPVGFEVAEAAAAELDPGDRVEDGGDVAAAEAGAGGSGAERPAGAEVGTAGGGPVDPFAAAHSGEDDRGLAGRAVAPEVARADALDRGPVRLVAGSGEEAGGERFAVGRRQGGELGGEGLDDPVPCRRIVGRRACRRACRRGRGGHAPNPAAIVATILPATIFVLAACLAVEHLWYETPLPLQATLRWVMAWSGYFGLWVSASLAFQMHRTGRAPAATAGARPTGGAAGPVASPAPSDPAAWDWVVEACAAELASLPAPDRAALAARLVAKAGYEQADDPGGIANARVELASRLAARIAGSAPGALSASARRLPGFPLSQE